MKIKHQLSIATLLMAGVFVTGCSQQQVAGGSQSAGSQQVSGGSQVAGGSQASGSQQVSGGSQVAGSSQSGSQQQVEGAAPVVAPEPAPVMKPKPVVQQPAPVMMKPKPRTNRWAHTHPAVPRCTKSVRHTHKYNQARHSHKYSCQRPAKRMMQKPVQSVDVLALQRKLKAKGYYKGPIDGIVGPGTRSALQRFMKR